MTQTTEYDTEAAENHTRKRAADRPIVVQFQGSPPSSGPRAPKRVEWVSLADEGDYAEHKIKARVRYPDTLNVEFSCGDFVRIKAALREVVLEHNGWIDPDTDEPMPPATDDGFWDLVAQEEVLLMLRAVGGARKKVLSLLLETKSD